MRTANRPASDHLGDTPRPPDVTLRCTTSEQLARLYTRHLKPGWMVLPAEATDARGGVRVRIILPGGKSIIVAASVTQMVPTPESLLRIVFATLSAEQIRELEGRLPRTPSGTPVLRLDDLDDGNLEGLYARVFGDRRQKG